MSTTKHLQLVIEKAFSQFSVKQYQSIQFLCYYNQCHPNKVS